MRTIAAICSLVLVASAPGARAFACPVKPGDPSVLSQLQSLASQWRDKFKSDNVGCIPLMTEANEASSDQSKKIDKLKSQMPAVWQSRPIEHGKRGYHRDNRHRRILDYADMVESARATSAKRKTYVGNCGEIGAHLYAYLYRNYKGISVALVQEIGVFADHGYVLVRCGSDVYIVDGWRGKAVGPMKFDSSGVYLLQASGKPHPDYTRGVEPLSSADATPGGSGGGVWHPATGNTPL